MVTHHINIDTKAFVVFANKLEKFRKSSLPNAIRGTLNSLAFDVKQRTMPVSADKHMEKRKPNFFKANSKVLMARSGDIKTMKAIVGFVSSSATYNNFAVRELEQQELGGSIPKRTFVPLDFSRSGQSNSGQVLPSNRLKTLKNIINSANAKGRNAREKFIKSAIHAGKRGYVIGNIGTRQTLFRINSIKRDKSGKTIIGKTPLYSFQHGRSVKIKKSTHFMREASYNSMKKGSAFFIREAKRQLSFR